MNVNSDPIVLINHTMDLLTIFDKYYSGYISLENAYNLYENLELNKVKFQWDSELKLGVNHFLNSFNNEKKKPGGILHCFDIYTTIPLYNKEPAKKKKH